MKVQLACEQTSMYNAPTTLYSNSKQKDNTKIASLLADIANFAAWKGQKKVYMAAEQAIAVQMIAELRSQKYDIKPAMYDVENPSTVNSSL